MIKITDMEKDINHILPIGLSVSEKFIISLYYERKRKIELIKKLYCNEIK